MRDALDVKEADRMKHVHDYEIRHNALSAEEFKLLWESVRGQPLTIEQARLAIENTLFSVFMYLFSVLRIGRASLYMGKKKQPPDIETIEYFKADNNSAKELSIKPKLPLWKKMTAIFGFVLLIAGVLINTEVIKIKK